MIEKPQKLREISDEITSGREEAIRVTVTKDNERKKRGIVRRTDRRTCKTQNTCYRISEESQRTKTGNNRMSQWWNQEDKKIMMRRKEEERGRDRKRQVKEDRDEKMRARTNRQKETDKKQKIRDSVEVTEIKRQKGRDRQAETDKKRQTRRDRQDGILSRGNIGKRKRRKR